MLRKRSHDTQGKHRIVARLRVGLADDVATGETEMIIFVDIIYLVICGVTTQQHRYDVGI